MSTETTEWLNTNTLTGYDQKPWHFVEGVSRAPYKNAVPEKEAVKLFPTILECEAGWELDGKWTPAPGSKMLVRADTKEGLTMQSDSYEVHQYKESLLGMGLPIASAGMLRGGRQAWVQYGHPDTVTTKDNVRFSTKVLAVTSCDSSLPTEFSYVTTLVVCDNTLRMARNSSVAAQRARHTRHSMGRVDEIRAAFGLIESVTDDVADEFTKDVRTKVSYKQLDKFLDKLLKVSPDMSPTARTRADNKRDGILRWHSNVFGDYQNTVFGVLQSVDAYNRWDVRLHKQTNVHERNMQRSIRGKFDQQMEFNRQLLVNA